MLQLEFDAGIKKLEAGFDRQYKFGALELIFEKIKNRPSEEWFEVVGRLLTETDRLPPAWKIIQSFPAYDQPKPTDPNEPPPGYWDILSARHEYAEGIVGEPFENFVKACNGDKPLASLYFGMAYWNAKGVHKYDQTYKTLISQSENGTPLAPILP